jgi:hypothetical protein
VSRDELRTGCVIRFPYLWVREAERGETEGRKARPVAVGVRKNSFPAVPPRAALTDSVRWMREIAADTTSDDLAKIEAASKHLHTVGFSEATINCAAKELQPRLSRKAQN